MKRLLIVTLVFGCGLEMASGQVLEGQELLVLDGGSGIQRISINASVATTVTFPAPINLVTGFGLVGQMEALANFDPKNTVSLVHFEQVGDDAIVVRLLREGTPCFLTVRSGGRIYLLQCDPAIEAHLAVAISEGNPDAGARPVGKKAIVKSKLVYQPMSLIGILKRAKQRPFLEKEDPSLYEGWEERNDIDLRSKCGDADVVVYAIQKWPEKDALVLRCVVQNNGGSQYLFDPRAVKVRVGSRVYPVQLCDASGAVAGFGTETMDLVLMGNVRGGRVHLAIENDFRVELSPPTDQTMDPAEREKYFTPDIVATPLAPDVIETK